MANPPTPWPLATMPRGIGATPMKTAPRWRPSAQMLADAPAPVAARRGRHHRLNKVRNPPGRAGPVRQARRTNCRPPSSTTKDPPREYFLNAVRRMLHYGRVSDPYSSPHDQIMEQLRLTSDDQGEAGVGARSTTRPACWPAHPTRSSTRSPARPRPTIRRTAHQGVEGTGPPHAPRPSPPLAAMHPTRWACRRPR